MGSFMPPWNESVGRHSLWQLLGSGYHHQEVLWSLEWFADAIFRVILLRSEKEQSLRVGIFGFVL